MADKRRGDWPVEARQAWIILAAKLAVLENDDLLAGMQPYYRRRHYARMTATCFLNWYVVPEWMQERCWRKAFISAIEHELPAAGWADGTLGELLVTMHAVEDPIIGRFMDKAA